MIVTWTRTWTPSPRVQGKHPSCHRMSICRVVPRDKDVEKPVFGCPCSHRCHVAVGSVGRYLPVTTDQEYRTFPPSETRTGKTRELVTRDSVTATRFVS